MIQFSVVIVLLIQQYQTQTSVWTQTVYIVAIVVYLYQPKLIAIHIVVVIVQQGIVYIVENIVVVQQTIVNAQQTYTVSNVYYASVVQLWCVAPQSYFIKQRIRTIKQGSWEGAVGDYARRMVVTYCFDTVQNSGIFF